MLANDIGTEYRAGLRALCERYRRDLRRVDRSALNEQELLTRDIFEHRLDTCVEDLDLPYTAYRGPLESEGARLAFVAASGAYHTWSMMPVTPVS